MPVVHEGYLLKRSSGTVPRWQKRWFVLSGDGSRKGAVLAQYKRQQRSAGAEEVEPAKPHMQPPKGGRAPYLQLIFCASH